MFNRLFLDHPRSVGETYFEHQRNALVYATLMFAGAIACLMHALIPGMFLTTGSRMVTKLYERMRSRRSAGSQRLTESWEI